MAITNWPRTYSVALLSCWENVVCICETSVPNWLSTCCCHSVVDSKPSVQQHPSPTWKSSSPSVTTQCVHSCWRHSLVEWHADTAYTLAHSTLYVVVHYRALYVDCDDVSWTTITHRHRHSCCSCSSAMLSQFSYRKKNISLWWNWPIRILQ